MDINKLRELASKNSVNIRVDNQKIVDSLNGRGSGGGFRERKENELNLTLSKDDVSRTVKVRMLGSPTELGYLRENGGDKYEGMGITPYYIEKRHWIGNAQAKVFYNTKCSSKDFWTDDSCPACNLARLAVSKRNDPDGSYWRRFLTGQQQGGLFNCNSTQQYLINVYVYTDSKYPQNEGKVMWFKASQGLYNKIIKPMVEGDEDAGIQGTNVTDLLYGKDFMISVKKGNPYNDYSSSRFLDTSPFEKMFIKTDPQGPSTKDNFETMKFETEEEFVSLISNPLYYQDSTDMKIYKLNEGFMKMLLNGADINGTVYHPLENLAKMTNIEFDKEAFVGEEAIGKFTDLCASFGVTIEGEKIQIGGTSQPTQNATYNEPNYDEPVITKESTASVEGITRNDVSQETVKAETSKATVTTSPAIEESKVDYKDWFN